MDELELELGNSQAGDGSTFRESVTVENLPIGSTWSGGVIEVRPGSDREAQFQRLIDENTALRDRVTELEQALQAVLSRGA